MVVLYHHGYSGYTATMAARRAGKSLRFPETSYERLNDLAVEAGPFRKRPLSLVDVAVAAVELVTAEDVGRYWRNRDEDDARTA